MQQFLEISSNANKPKMNECYGK